MAASRLVVGLIASGAIVALSGVPKSERLVTQLPYGWTTVGQVILDRSGCVECPATFPTTSGPVTFGLATDSRFPISLAGRFDVKCIDGSTYNVFLNSPMRSGVFQLVPNLCLNYESASVALSMTSVSLSPPDANRRIALTVLGTN